VGDSTDFHKGFIEASFGVLFLSILVFILTQQMQSKAEIQNCKAISVIFDSFLVDFSIRKI